MTVRWPHGGEADWHLQADSQGALDALRAAVDEIVALPCAAGTAATLQAPAWWRR